MAETAEEGTEVHVVLVERWCFAWIGDDDSRPAMVVFRNRVEAAEAQRIESQAGCRVSALHKLTMAIPP